MNDLSGTVNLVESAQLSAGKNAIINGDFGIWQRGTSFSANVYNADRWNNLSDATVTTSRQSFTPGTAPASPYESTFFQRTTKSAGGTFVIQEQRIEDVRTFSNFTVTLSFWAKADAAVTLSNNITQNFGSGGSTQLDTAFSTVSLTTSWTRYTMSVLVPGVSGKTIGANNYLGVRVVRALTSAATTIDIWGVQLEASSVASGFQTATGTKQGELAACQRYYYRSFPGAITKNLGIASAASTTLAQVLGFFPVEMRIVPTALEQSGTANQYGVVFGTTNTTCSAVPAYGASTTNSCWQVNFTVASGLTLGQAGKGSTDLTNGAGAFLGWSAEL
jgi:hypothetical protein